MEKKITLRHQRNAPAVTVGEQAEDDGAHRTQSQRRRQG